VMPARKWNQRSRKRKPSCVNSDMALAPSRLIATRAYSSEAPGACQTSI
jgi:hypothetical protein